ncbi:hypothetical protein MBLNU230_g5228t1 [Neophaeotheca triangularis]
MSWSDVPSDILTPCNSNTKPSSQPSYCNNSPSFSDDLAALDETLADTKRAHLAARTVVQHRRWTRHEIFPTSEAAAPSSPPANFQHEQDNEEPLSTTMTSSPPPTPPFPTRKRKQPLGGELDLGHNSLAPSRPVKAKRSYYGVDVHALLEQAKAEEVVEAEYRRAAGEMPTPPGDGGDTLSVAADTPGVAANPPNLAKPTLLWTEKYRARKFTDLIGDERTHRSVMHWLKRWDSIVYPGVALRPTKSKKNDGTPWEEKPHRKILLLTGPPGLGKTTLAHVCAKQAGYEVQEINASDERSGQVVKGRIRDMVGTENVRGVEKKGVGVGGKSETVRKAGKPVCVVVDEVDGVVSGSGGGGEGGFVKALIDLVNLDQKNTNVALGGLQQGPAAGKKKKGDRFRLLRPMILICNDVYHPSLRPLRQSSLAEIVHGRKPPIQAIVARMQAIFDRENVPCESDGVRRLCEAAWGVSNRKEDKSSNGAGEGDMRGIMVVGEWVAGKLRASNATSDGNGKLTRRWVEDNILSDLSHGGGAARGLGRGGPRDIVDRVFQEGAGFPKTSLSSTASNTTSLQQTAGASIKGVAESHKRTSTTRLRELLDTHGDCDRIVTDVFATYPDNPYQDDTLLSKPTAAYEWLHFHDTLQTAVYHSSEWEMAPYLSTPILAFHHLFASQMRKPANLPPDNPTADQEPAHPLTTPQASFAAHEATKANSALLQTFHSQLSQPLTRLFPSTADLVTDLLPNLLRMLSPKINPTIITGSGDKTNSTATVRKTSEQALVARAVQAMSASGLRFEKSKLSWDEDERPPQGQASWVYRLTPDIETLGLFATGGKGFGQTGATRTRYAVRQVLDQEWQKESRRLAEVSRMARFGGSGGAAQPQLLKRSSAAAGLEGEEDDGVGKIAAKVERDFFGRVVVTEGEGARQLSKKEVLAKRRKKEDDERVWVQFREGWSNAVRKPLSLGELVGGL